MQSGVKDKVTAYFLRNVVPFKYSVDYLVKEYESFIDVNINSISVGYFDIRDLYRYKSLISIQRVISI
jgi:hypothetical protein